MGWTEEELVAHVGEPTSREGNQLRYDVELPDALRPTWDVHIFHLEDGRIVRREKGVAWIAPPTFPEPGDDGHPRMHFMKDPVRE